MKISLEEIKKSIYQCIADWEKDGRYNHVAFVVASGSKISSGYDDVTIAQHTSNCCASNLFRNRMGKYLCSIKFTIEELRMRI